MENTLIDSDSSHCYRMHRDQENPQEKPKVSGNPSVVTDKGGERGGGSEGRPAGWFVWDTALPRLLPADLRPPQLPSSSLLSVWLLPHAGTFHYLLMPFQGSSWQHRHYLWGRGPLQRRLIHTIRLSTLSISWLALIKSEGSQHFKCCVCTNKMTWKKMGEGVRCRWRCPRWFCFQ